MDYDYLNPYQDYSYALARPPPLPTALVHLCGGNIEELNTATSNGNVNANGTQITANTPAPPGFKYQNPNGFIPPGKHGTNYQTVVAPPRPPSAIRPLKRKYSAGPGTVAKEAKEIVEKTPDGKLIIFQGRDESYPDELNALIHPLKCDLCPVQSNSMQSAKDHYESKLHDRNITNWLVKTYKDKGLEPPVVKRFLKSGPAGPDAFHCDVCDLNLTSLVHANQHFAGRKHKLASSKKSKPSGSGYYNTEGKWVRTGTKYIPKAANDNRFGIGEGFKDLITPNPMSTETDANSGASVSSTTTVTNTTKVVAEEAKSPVSYGRKYSTTLPTHAKAITDMDITKAVTVNATLAFTPDTTSISPTSVKTETSTTTTTTPLTTAINNTTTSNNPVYCSICNIFVTSFGQMQAHLDGAKHRKKLTQTGFELAPKVREVQNAENSILASINEKPADIRNDVSMYRTPSGTFYCKSCDVSMCHESALQQHLKGKKHGKKALVEKLIEKLKPDIDINEIIKN